MRRRLAEIEPYAAVRFETLPRIAELLGAGRLAGEGRSPLARPLADYLAEQVARESRGGLSQVHDLPGYARVLRWLFARLRRGGIVGAKDVADSHRQGHLREILRLYGRFREETRRFYDAEDLLDAAVEVIRSGLAGALTDLGDIYVVAPGARSAGAAALLAALRDVAPKYTELDEPTPVPETGFVLAPDPAGEAKEAVREVLGALEAGLSLHEIAVFHGADASYQRALREAFDAADIPIVPLPGVPLFETPAGRGVLAFALLPEKDFARTAAFDFLSVAPLKERLPAGDGEVRSLTSAWDRLSREAGITHGAQRWSDTMAAFIADTEDQLGDPRAAENETRQRVLAMQRDQGRDLLSVMDRLIHRLEPLRPEQGAMTFIPAFEALVGDYFDRKATGLDSVIEEIDQLGAIAAVGGSISLASFARALRANLEAATIREHKLGDGVIVAGYRAAAGLQFKRIVLCGAYEGAFPAGPGADVLVHDSAWARLRRDHPHVEDAALRIERARADAHRAVAAAGSGRLVWSAPLYEPAGTREFYPSPMMVAAAAKMDASITTASELRRHAAAAWLRRGASPLAMTSRGPVVDRGEIAVRSGILQRRKAARVGSDHPRSDALAMLRARRGSLFTEWDGNLAGLSGDALFDLKRAMSPTSLENYGVCGFRYFCRSLLRLNSAEEPEEREMMDPARRGSLIHDVLETFFREQKERGRPAPGEAWSEEDAESLLAIMGSALAAAKKRGRTGLDIYSEHEARTMRSDLAAFLEADTAFRFGTGAVPTDFELAIPELTIAGIRLRGYVDRVDRSPDGRRAWVIDYKSGSSSSFKSIKADDPFAGGTKLQLPTYLAAAADAEEVNAAYWFITRRGDFSFIEYEPTPERQELFERTLHALVEGVRAGAFPAVSGEENDFYGGFDNCRYCDFDRICSRRRDYELAAKREHRALSPWLDVGRTARDEDRP
jgi:RecB family exonuclease